MRVALATRLESEGRYDLAARINRCGIPTGLTCTACGHVHRSLTRCKNKWCPACQRSLAAARSEKLAFAVRKMRWPLFVTLTQGNLDEICDGGIREFRRAFGRLRNKKFWKLKVRGGVAAMEVTNIGNGWHVHLHAVIDCRWLSILSTPPTKNNTPDEIQRKIIIAKSELQEAWRQCLRQEKDPVIHVKRANGDIEKEVVKYSVKGSDLLECEEEIGPLIDAMDGTRMLTTFGCCYGLTKKMLEEGEEPTPFLCPAGHSAWMPEGLVDIMKSKTVDEWRQSPGSMSLRTEAERASDKAIFKEKMLEARLRVLKIAEGFGLAPAAVRPASQSDVVPVKLVKLKSKLGRRPWMEDER